MVSHSRDSRVKAIACGCAYSSCHEHAVITQDAETAAGEYALCSFRK